MDEWGMQPGRNEGFCWPWCYSEMESRQPVTLVSGDRYSLAPPDRGVVHMVSIEGFAPSDSGSSPDPSAKGIYDQR